MTTDDVMENTVASSSLTDLDQETIEGAMQLSPDMINVRSVGASESVQAIVGLAIPAGYHLADYDFTLSFNDEDVTTAYDCYYCYVDNNLIISFRKNEILASPVTLGFVNTVAVATVSGYFRVEDEAGGYDTSLSTVASVEIFDPAHANKTDQSARTVSEY